MPSLGKATTPALGRNRDADTGTLVAWLVPGVVIGILGIPRPPWRQWMTAAALIVFIAIAAIVGPYLTRHISYGTAPLLSLFMASAIGALCILPARVLPDQDRMWWPDFSFSKRDPDQHGRRNRQVTLLCAALFADLVVWAWVRDPSAYRPDLRANVAASLQVLVLVPIAGLQASYLRALIRRDDRGRKRGYMTKEELAYGKVAWSRLIGLGVPTGVLVLSMIGEVISRNGLDQPARPAAWQPWPLLAAFAGAWAVLLVVRAYVGTLQQSLDTLDLPTPVAIPVIIAPVGVFLVAYLIDHVFFQIGWVIVMAVIYGAATAHSLHFHAVGEHLIKSGASVVAVIAAVGISSAFLMLWLLSCALWINGRPLYTSNAVSITVLILIGNGILVWTIGTLLTARRARNLSGYTTEQNLGIDLLTYTGLGIVLAVLPDLLVGHLKHVPHNELLWVLLVPAGFLGWQAVKFMGKTFEAVNYMLKEDEIKALLIEGERPPSPEESQLHDQRIRSHFSGLKAATLLTVTVSVIWILSAAV
jgi:hypothetical protein